MTPGHTPVLHVIAGPNGAGKSVFADRFLLPSLAGLPFVNADLIERAAREAGEAIDSYRASERAAQIRRRLIDGRHSFVFETVFSHPSKLELLADARTAGYLATLHVLMVPADLAVIRVTLRARQGGHAVPEDKVRSRHTRLWALVAEAIRTLTDDAYVYDSSRGTPQLSARYHRGALVGPAQWPSWAPQELTQR